MAYALTTGDYLRRRLRPLATRLRLRDTLLLASRTLWIGAAGFALVQIAGRLLPIPNLLLWSLVPPLLWVLVILGYLLVRPLPLPRVAQRVDSALDLRERLATALLGNSDVLPIGLGARDSLRLEAGLCLYGHDIDATTTPVEGALEWSIQKSRRHGGARAGGFPGADQILSQLENGAARRRVGLRPEGRAPVREGAPLFPDAASSEQIGKVTSGGFGPSINAPVAMGYLPSSHAIGGLVFAELRGQRLPLRVAATPFVPNTYKR